MGWVWRARSIRYVQAQISDMLQTWQSDLSPSQSQYYCECKWKVKTREVSEQGKVLSPIEIMSYESHGSCWTHFLEICMPVACGKKGGECPRGQKCDLYLRWHAGLRLQCDYQASSLTTLRSCLLCLTSKFVKPCSALLHLAIKVYIKKENTILKNSNRHFLFFWLDRLVLKASKWL